MPRGVLSRVKYALAATAVLGLAANGAVASTGVESESAAAIVAASQQAAVAATSVHMRGTLATKGGPTKFDLTLVSGRGGRGTLSVNGLSFRLIRVGSATYVQGSLAFYQHYAGSAARLLTGKWLKGSATTGSFASITRFTDLVGFLRGLLSTSSSTRLTKGATTTVSGQRVIQIADGQGGTLSVAITGAPYPVRISKPGSSGGTIKFDRWNAPVRLAAPLHSITLKALTTH